jgi:hypothetical protein
MSELVEEDVVDGCTRVPVVVPGGIRPLDLANLRPVYSISSEVKEIA